MKCRVIALRLGMEPAVNAGAASVGGHQRKEASTLLSKAICAADATSGKGPLRSAQHHGTDKRKPLSQDHGGRDGIVVQ